MAARGRLSLLACALVVIGIALGFRYQKALEERLFAARLAADLAPDESVKLARALEKLTGGEAALERLSPEAKLRYLVAAGFTLRELAPVAFAGKKDPREDAAAIVAAMAREAELQALVRDLTARHGAVALRFLAEASDAAVRRRAAQALSLGGDAGALPALAARFADPDREVQVSAFTAGITILRRAPERDARRRFLCAAAPIPGLEGRALEAARADPAPEAIPVLIAYLEHPKALEPEKALVAGEIRRLAGPERSASAPEGIDPAAWRAWWEGQAGGR